MEKGKDHIDQDAPELREGDGDGAGPGMQEFVHAFSEMFSQSNRGMAEALTKALKRNNKPVPKISKFSGIVSTGEADFTEWSEAVNEYCDELGVDDRAKVVLDHVSGPAKEEVLAIPNKERDNLATVLAALKLRFSVRETVSSLNSLFYTRSQSENEDLATYSASLMRIHNRIVNAAASGEEKRSLENLRDAQLKERFVAGIRNATVRQDLNRILIDFETRSFSEMRAHVLKLYPDASRPKSSTVREVEVMSVSPEVSDQAPVNFSDPVCQPGAHAQLSAPPFGSMFNSPQVINYGHGYNRPVNQSLPFSQVGCAPTLPWQQGAISGPQQVLGPFNQYGQPMPAPPQPANYTSFRSDNVVNTVSNGKIFYDSNGNPVLGQMVFYPIPYQPSQYEPRVQDSRFMPESTVIQSEVHYLSSYDGNMAAVPATATLVDSNNDMASVIPSEHVEIKPEN